MGNQYRKRFAWVTMPDDLATDAMPDGVEGYENDPPAPKGEPFRAKVLINPTGYDVRHEQELRTALIADELPEREYLLDLSDRVIDWNLEVIGNDGKPFKVAAPGAHAENEDSLNGWYALELTQLGWLLGQVRFAYLPKRTTQTSPTAGTTDSNTANSPSASKPSPVLAD